MRPSDAQPGSVAVVCGSSTVVGHALVTRLRQSGWDVLAADPPGTAPHPVAWRSFQGEVWQHGFWHDLAAQVSASGRRAALFVHALSGFAAPAAPVADSIESPWQIAQSAELGISSLAPLLRASKGSVVFVASALAGWDTRADHAAYSASQAALPALVRSLALAGGPEKVRANAVCIGLVADPGLPDGGVSLAERARIPLGAPAEPDDIVDAILFLASDDARHVSGSTLLVDGGQSLQSWSNAPRATGYRPSRPTRPAEFDADRRFAGKTVLITGAGGGLGSAAARRFATEGASLALLDRDLDAVEMLADALPASQRTAAALALHVDVADESSMSAAFARAEEHFGSVDVIFNNAGIGSGSSSIADMTPAQWDEVIAINLRGVYLGCHLGVPALIRAGGGAIVNMGSSTGRHDTITGGAAYMASKAAVEAMTKSLALQTAPFGIRANTICPGIIQTQLSFRQQDRDEVEQFFGEFAARIPLGRVGQPEDIAGVVAFLASDQARHITGASLLIDGGQTRRRWISAPDLMTTESF